MLPVKKILHQSIFCMNEYLLVQSADMPFANSLDQDQAQQNVGPDLGTNCMGRLSADDRVKTCVNPSSDTINLQQTTFSYFDVFIFCYHLLIAFANSLNPDQARQNVGPDLDPICLILRWYS